MDVIAEVYNVCGMQGHLDNVVTGTGMHLSEFYVAHNEQYFKCNQKTLPVEICMAHSNSFLSVQVHPDDKYALLHENSRGRPEGGVIIEANDNTRSILGHNAKTREEFANMVENKDWENLFRYVEEKVDYYTDTPAWTLHALGKDALCVAFSTNADITYRLYDFERLDPKTNKPR